jgi:hypothetical protein
MKRFYHLLLFATVSLAPSLIFGAQVNPRPEKATLAVLRAFETHNIVMIGEIKQAGIRLVPFFGSHS